MNRFSVEAFRIFEPSFAAYCSDPTHPYKISHPHYADETLSNRARDARKSFLEANWPTEYNSLKQPDTPQILRGAVFCLTAEGVLMMSRTVHKARKARLNSAARPVLPEAPTNIQLSGHDPALSEQLHAIQVLKRYGHFPLTVSITSPPPFIPLQERFPDLILIETEETIRIL